MVKESILAKTCVEINAFKNGTVEYRSWTLQKV
jgi:hypothetical protein